MFKEQDGQIIVTEFRPMSEAPRDDVDILCIDGNYDIYALKNFGDDKWYQSADVPNYDGSHVFYISEYELVGWIPMPVYKPKE